MTIVFESIHRSIHASIVVPFGRPPPPFPPLPGGGPPRSRRALLPGPEPALALGTETRRPGCDRPSNVIIARVNDIRFPVTLEALHTIFSVYGPIEKIVTFDKGGGFQALVQYPT